MAQYGMGGGASTQAQAQMLQQLYARSGGGNEAWNQRANSLLGSAGASLYELAARWHSCSSMKASQWLCRWQSQWRRQPRRLYSLPLSLEANRVCSRCCRVPVAGRPAGHAATATAQSGHGEPRRRGVASRPGRQPLLPAAAGKLAFLCSVYSPSQLRRGADVCPAAMWESSVSSQGLVKGVVCRLGTRTVFGNRRRVGPAVCRTRGPFGVLMQTPKTKFYWAAGGAVPAGPGGAAAAAAAAAAARLRRAAPGRGDQAGRAGQARLAAARRRRGLDAHRGTSELFGAEVPP